MASLPDALTDEESRLTTGLESTAASSSNSSQHLLIDFMLTSPIAGKPLSRTTKPLIGAWFNARLNGAATTSVKGVKQFVGGFDNKLVSAETSGLINTLTFRAGIEGKLPKLNGANLADNYQIQVLWLAAAGFVTPPPPTKPGIFEISPAARTRWNIPATVDIDGTSHAVKYLGFLEPDRKTFYPRWEIGLRVKSHHFADCDEHDDCETRRENFPGMIDITWGPNGAITGGRFAGSLKGRAGKVVTIDAFYPLPTDSLANALYLFGSAQLQTLPAGELSERPQIILKAATATVEVPSPELFLYTPTAEERSRDQWKFGLGFDLIRLFKLTEDSRAEDRAAASADRGFSRGRVYPAPAAADDKEVTVTRIVMQPGETGRIVHGTDVLIPETPGTLREVTRAGTQTVTYTAGQPVVALSTRRDLTNPGAADFRMLMVRVNPGEAKGENWGVFSPHASFKSDAHPVDTDARYQVSVVTCTVACDVKSPDTTDNLIVVIPLADSATTATIGTDQPQTFKAYTPLIVERKKALAIAGGTPTFVVVRLK